MSAKATASKERDAMKAQLAAMMSGASAPGAEQAERAVKKNEPSEPKPKLASQKEAPKKKLAAATPKRKPVSQKSKPKRKTEGAERAEKISVSLHPTDQDNAEAIEDALRDAGLINRRAPVSFLLKVALASFDPARIEDLESVVQSVKARDGRGKWMKEMATK